VAEGEAVEKGARAEVAGTKVADAGAEMVGKCNGATTGHLQQCF